MIDVSVIVPVYNAHKHLEECIKSITSQTLKNIEIICVDDGSRDSSLEILEKFVANDARIRIIHQKNAGAAAARNHGLTIAKGKYLSFLDSDDFFEPTMLEDAFKKAEEENSEIVVFKADFYNDHLEYFSPCTYSLRENMLPAQRPFAGNEVQKDVFKVIVGWAWDKLFLTDFVRKNELKFQELRTSNDMLFVFSAFIKAQRISTLPEILVHQRRGESYSLSRTREKSWMCFYEALIALRQKLFDWKVYDRFEADYINYALHFSLWNLNTLKGTAKKKLYYKLKWEWFKELGIKDFPKEKFYHKGEYLQFLQVMKLPYNKTLQSILSFIQRGLTWFKRKIKK